MDARDRHQLRAPDRLAAARSLAKPRNMLSSKGPMRVPTRARAKKDAAPHWLIVRSAPIRERVAWGRLSPRAVSESASSAACRAAPDREAAVDADPGGVTDRYVISGNASNFAQRNTAGPAGSFSRCEDLASRRRRGPKKGESRPAMRIRDLRAAPQFDRRGGPICDIRPGRRPCTRSSQSRLRRFHPVAREGEADHIAPRVRARKYIPVASISMTRTAHADTGALSTSASRHNSQANHLRQMSYWKLRSRVICPDESVVHMLRQNP